VSAFRRTSCSPAKAGHYATAGWRLSPVAYAVRHLRPREPEEHSAVVRVGGCILASDAHILPEDDPVPQSRMVKIFKPLPAA